MNPVSESSVEVQLPRALAQDPLDPALRLELVRERGKSHWKWYPTKDGFRYAPIYGITAVMMLSPQAIEQFARPLHAALDAISELREAILLLPPESYHMTLRGLEETLASATIAEYRKLEARYRAIFFATATDLESSQSLGDSLAEEPPTPTTFALQEVAKCLQVLLSRELPSFRSAAVLYVHPNGLLGEQLQLAQAATAECLRVPLHEQCYHISVGYYVTTDKQKQLWAQQVVHQHAQRILGDRLIDLERVKVCWYASMEAFWPLFESSSVV